MRHKLARVARMDRAELWWRSRVAVRRATQRGVATVQRPRWNPPRLADALAADAGLYSARDALRRRDLLAAHRRLSAHFAHRPPAFLISAHDRAAVAERIRTLCPSAPGDATARADRIIRGEYDLLGYSGLTFPRVDASGRRDATLPDWHADPVHNRRAPDTFWSRVPFLDPTCGDHKIIWELNRHQHWLALGRAHWLTDEPRYRDRFIGELVDWREANPPLTGINWASMLELAFRSLSWLWALHFFAGSEADRDRAPWTVLLLEGLDRQLLHIEQNLSYYFSPNTHLLGEALALYVGGRALPELVASARRADLGRRILVAELSRQVTPDGGHCERSTHYHRYTLDFYAMALAVARVTRDPIAAVFERALERLAMAARALADDTGRAPHLGDDDGGMLLPLAGRAADDWRDSLAIAGVLTGRRDLSIGPIAEEACWLLAHPAFAQTWRSYETKSSAPTAWRSTALADTGYYVSRSTSGVHLVLDGGPHGYQNAGHAHADALAMTMSIRGLPLLIDPGTACYSVDSTRRDRFRSTAMHNTLLLDGRPQSLPSGPFHWTRSAHTSTHRWRTTHAFDYFDGSHDGYLPATHRRRVFALHDDVVIVADHVDDPSRSTHTAAVHWHIDPSWTVDAAGRLVSFRSRHERAALVVPQGEVASVTADSDGGLGWHSPVYGRVEPCATVAITHEGAAPLWIVSVFDLNPLDPVLDATFLPVWAEAGAVAHAAGLRIDRRGSIDFALFAEPSADARRPVWRVAELETDAVFLQCSLGPSGQITRLALVDGSFVRGSGRRALGIGLGKVVPALYLDESSIRNYTPCAALPAL